MAHPIESRFNSRATALEVARDFDLSGRLAVVTGSGGIGRSTALALASAGAEIVLGGRRETDLVEARSEIARQVPGAVVHIHQLDLAEPANVTAFAQAVLALNRPLDMLVNNAGVAGCPLGYTSLGVETHFATNFLGHALLSSLLAAALKRASQGRMVCLTSSAHQLTPIDFGDINYRHRPYEKFMAYAQSKTACSLLATYLGTALNPHGIAVHSVHPGVVQTDIIRHLTTEDFDFLAGMRATLHVKDVHQGAATSVWAALDPALAARAPLYLEDCGVATVIDQAIGTDHGFGVMRHAIDPEFATRLWGVAEEMLGRTLPL